MSKEEQLQVTILGSGTIVPRLDRSGPAVLVRAGGLHVLLDAGPGAMRQLVAAKSHPALLSAVFISHLHPDHTAELGPLIFALKYGRFAEREQPLRIMGGRGIGRFLDILAEAWGRWVALTPQMSVRELDNERRDRTDLDGLIFQTAPSNHTDQSLSVRIEYLGKSVVYSGDTGESPELVALARGADLLLCEASMPDETPVPGHMTPSAAGRTAAEAGVKTLVLTHLYPEADAVDIVSQCRRTYSGNLFVAADLMEFTA
ncbi:MAG: MBL fold metallo-hydrolase [Thermodesulfobacteriota bacterium]